jgi:hypothetical protein
MINGDVAPGYEVVKEQFAENLASHKEVGAACAVSLDGDPVVDLWRGESGPMTELPWR